MKKENILIPGNLYLKKVHAVKLYDSKEEADIESYRQYGKEGFIPTMGKDYSRTNSLYSLVILDNSKLLLKEYSKLYPNNNIMVTPEELNSGYIPLIDFLFKADYVGKHGVRLEPTALGNHSYMSKPVLVLYKSDTHIIIYNDDIKNNERDLPIKILNESYVDNWKFSGPTFDVYRKPGELFSEIYKKAIPKGKGK